MSGKCLKKNDRFYKSAFEFYIIVFKLKETLAPVSWYFQLNSSSFTHQLNPNQFGINLDYGHKHSQL